MVGQDSHDEDEDENEDEDEYDKVLCTLDMGKRVTEKSPVSFI
jgi:hypothetical protein